MVEIGEQRDFEDILSVDPEEARRVIERLYVHQEATIKRDTLAHFHYLLRNGYMD
jgi:hypothetical protein